MHNQTYAKTERGDAIDHNGKNNIAKFGQQGSVYLTHQ